ncbi:MAG: T9SS type A sorting domain-containing protein [Bacteroidales bacterium]|nr:T9SS type A sorting domain-containing protein [Bacteroidales bacterium]
MERNWSFDGTMQVVKGIPTPMFYISQNFFKFIKPGSQRVEISSNQPDLYASAWKNTDNSYSIVVINKSTSDYYRTSLNGAPGNMWIYRSSQFEHCDYGDFYYKGNDVVLPPNSVSTFMYKKGVTELPQYGEILLNEEIKTIENNSWSIYPNPASDFINISMPQSLPGTIQIKDINGRTVRTVNLTAYSEEIKIRVDDLISGHYCVQFINKNESQVIGRFLVK